MRQKRLTCEEVDFIMQMKRVSYSNCEIARRLRVTEGAIRYRIKRRHSGKEDRRRHKPSQLDRYRGVIKGWIEDYSSSRHRPTIKALYAMLRGYHGYGGSYDAVRRFVRKRFPEFHKRGYKVRIETPPGKLLQIDWKEDLQVQMGYPGRWVVVHALCCSLGFSRKAVIAFREKKDLPSFISAQQEAFGEFGGLPESIRIDCLKSAIIRYFGRESILNETYRRYVTELGIVVFPARPGVASDKGKVEKRIRDIFSGMDFKHHVYRDMGDLSRRAKAKLTELERVWRCGATGLSVAESFAYEQHSLRELPRHFPRIPVEERRTVVRRDGTVYFSGNYYQVMRDYIERSVLCMNTGTEIIIWHAGEEIGRYPYLPQARGMVLLSEEALQDPRVCVSDTVRGWALEVARRQVEHYHHIIQGGVR